MDPGEVVAAGAPVVTAADISHPYTDVFVPEGDVDGIEVGAPATVHVDASPEPFARTSNGDAARSSLRATSSVNASGRISSCACGCASKILRSACTRACPHSPPSNAWLTDQLSGSAPS